VDVRDIDVPDYLVMYSNNIPPVYAVRRIPKFFAPKNIDTEFDA